MGSEARHSQQPDAGPMEQAYIRYGQEAKARETKALDEFAVIGCARARRAENG